jgi:hypothetical protein
VRSLIEYEGEMNVKLLRTLREGLIKNPSMKKDNEPDVQVLQRGWAEFRRFDCVP